MKRLFIILLCLISASPLFAPTYLASSYNADEEGDSQLCLYTSENGITFTTLYEDVYYAESPSTHVRDPGIITVGSYYYGTFTTSYQGMSPKTIDVIRSNDLQNWTRIAQISWEGTAPIETGGDPVPAYGCWAPQWFVDSDGSVHIIATIWFHSAAFGDLWRPYKVTATNSDLTSWSSWSAIAGTWTAGVNSYDKEYSQHDIFIIKKDAIYYAFFGCPESTASHKGDIQYATSSSPFSGYTTQGIALNGSSYFFLEGPCILQLANGTYRLYVDQSLREGIYYSESADLITWPEPSLTTWDTVDGTTQHPTVQVYEAPAISHNGSSGIFFFGF